MVLGARVLLIKFIQFRDTFQHYIQLLILAGLRLLLILNLLLHYWERDKIALEKNSKRQNFIKTKFHGGSILHGDTF